MKRPIETFRSLFSRTAATARSPLPAQAEHLPLPELLLRADKIAASLNAGLHGRRRAGMGEDFWQFRPYHPGEPATAIDWRQSARSPVENSFWVRERERENAQSLLLWCDPSASMRWRSSEALPTKEDSARLCTLALAASALRGGERVGLLSGPEKGRTFAGKHTLPRLGEALLHPGPQEPDLPDLSSLPPNADLVLISDFLWDESRFDDLLARCTRHPVRTHLLCILDPAEKTLPFTGRIRFSGLEGGHLTLPATESLGAGYARLMQDHLDHLLRSAGKLHMTCRVHETSENPVAALLPLVLAMGHFR